MELMECVQRNNRLCEQFRPQFFEELKRDRIVKEDEENTKKAMFLIHYLQSQV